LDELLAISTPIPVAAAATTGFWHEERRRKKCRREPGDLSSDGLNGREGFAGGR